MNLVFGDLPDVAWALQERDAKGTDSDTKEGHLIVARPLAVRKGNSSLCEDKETFVTGPLLAEGADAGGSITGTPLVVDEAFSFESRVARNGRGKPESVTPPLKAMSGNSSRGDSAPLNAVYYKYSGNAGHNGGIDNMIVDEGAYQNHGNNVGPMGTLRTQTDSVPFTLAFDERQITSRENRSNPQPGDPVHTLPSDTRAPAAIAFANGQGDPNADESGLSYALDAGRGVQGVQGNFGVRRLTPTECCRLQGFPDDWFEGTGLSDSAMYRCLGNAVATKCSLWLGQRILSVGVFPTDASKNIN